MHWLVSLYHRLIAHHPLVAPLLHTQASLRRERIALHMVAVAQEAQSATASQLAVCRGLLAVVMRERDDYHALAEALQLQLTSVREELDSLRAERFTEHQQIRFWLTRTAHGPQNVEWN